MGSRQGILHLAKRLERDIEMLWGDSHSGIGYRNLYFAGW